MRKVIFAIVSLMIASAPVMLSSCGDDEPDTPSTPVIPDNPVKPDNPGGDTPSVTKGKLAGTQWWTVYDGERAVLKFYDDGTFYEDWSGDGIYKYEENGNELLVESGCMLYNLLLQPCKFRLNGNTLEIYDSTETITFKKML